MAVNMEAVLKIKMLGYFKEQLVKIFAPKDLATQEKEGLFSKEDKAKLDGIEMNATNYKHPDTHPATMIDEDESHRFTTDAEKAGWNATTQQSNELKDAYDKHIASIVDITEEEVEKMLTDAGMPEIA